MATNKEESVNDLLTAGWVTAVVGCPGVYAPGPKLGSRTVVDNWLVSKQEQEALDRFIAQLGEKEQIAAAERGSPELKRP